MTPSNIFNEKVKFSILSFMCVYIYIYIYPSKPKPSLPSIKYKIFLLFMILEFKRKFKNNLIFNKCLRKYHSNEPLAEHQRGQSAKVSPKFLKIIYITMWCDYIYLQVALFENTTLPLNFLNVLILFTVSKLINKTQTN